MAGLQGSLLNEPKTYFLSDSFKLVRDHSIVQFNGKPGHLGDGLMNHVEGRWRSCGVALGHLI